MYRLHGVGVTLKAGLRFRKCSVTDHGGFGVTMVLGSSSIRMYCFRAGLWVYPRRAASPNIPKRESGCRATTHWAADGTASIEPLGLSRRSALVSSASPPCFSTPSSHANVCLLTVNWVRRWRPTSGEDRWWSKRGRRRRMDGRKQRVRFRVSSSLSRVEDDWSDEGIVRRQVLVVMRAVGDSSRGLESASALHAIRTRTIEDWINSPLT